MQLFTGAKQLENELSNTPVCYCAEFADGDVASGGSGLGPD